jgi:glycine cleavage system aminomethyltransferase T
MDMPSPFTAPLALPVYPDATLWTTDMGVPTPWKFNGWQAETMSWKTGCYIHAGLSGPQFRFFGKNAAKLVEKVVINRVDNWEPGTEKHAVMLTPEGLVGSHGLMQRSKEDEFTMYAAGIWPLYQAGNLGIEIETVPLPLYIFQVSGPTALQTLERATDEDLRDIKFLTYRTATIAGKTVEVARIGMSGTLAYEVRGPYDEGPAVYDAIYKAGADFGIERLGWDSYFVNHVEGGFPQGGWTFKFAMPLDGSYLEFLKMFGMDWVTHVSMVGSYDPADIRARERTPFEIGWGKYAKFDHDFVGRDALEKEAADPKRTIVTLKWNAEDVADIYTSLLRDGEPYRQLGMPKSGGGMMAHADRVLKDGRVVGIASAPVYSLYYRDVITHGTVDLDVAAQGTELIIEWGDFGGTIKKVRATVERFPYLELERNQNYDLSNIPTGLQSVPV